MNEVGAMSILLGIVVVCSRGALLVAPAATLRWFAAAIGTNSGSRVFGALGLALGASMAWAGAGEDSGLATILSVVGWASVGISAVALVLFPAIYRAIVEAVLPSDIDTDVNLSGWRVLGLAGVVVGGLFIYFGALAL